MGQSCYKETFSQQDLKTFKERLNNQLDNLKHWLETDSMPEGEASVGAEIEMYLVDSGGSPAPQNQLVIDKLADPQLQPELNQFNLEYNLSPVPAKGTPFLAMERELRPVLDKLQSIAAHHQLQVVPIGILPTLKQEHLQKHFMTDLPRYRALTQQLSALKGAPFEVNINGQDSLITQCDEVTLEGANTSFQVHLKVPPTRFVDMFNTAQLITPLVLALSGNSPTFLSKRLWQETRIALFKQSIDNRVRCQTQWRQPSRVSFGQGWLRKSPWECFSQSVALYPPILPLVSETGADYEELNLHHGTVWSWNRAVLEPKGGGHLRIEYRAFPAGPTVVDMMASAALAIGLTVGLSQHIESYLVKLPFQYAEYNFYRSAQHGLDAKLLWPQDNQHHPTEEPVTAIIERLFPVAEEGLKQLGVEHKEIQRLMSINQDKLANKQTGSTWQLNTLETLQQSMFTDVALQQMLQLYIKNMMEGQPVSQWSPV